MVPLVDVQAARAAVQLPHLVGADVRLTRQGGLWTACCPFHPDKTPSFVVWPDHFHCFGCGVHGDAIEWLRRTRRLTFRQAVTALACGSAAPGWPRPPAPPRPSAGRDLWRDRMHLQLAASIWNESLPAHSTAAETYIQYRLRRTGFDVPDVLRYHPSCPRGLRRADRLPAMIALMTDPLTGQETGIHRTYLQSDGHGKALVDRPKMMLGRAGVVRLLRDDQVDAVIGIAEGIETALACIHLGGGGPCWATLGDGGMQRFPVIPSFRGINIFADPNKVGVVAASECRKRWELTRRQCRVFVPPAEVSDFLDLALQDGW